MEEKLKQRLFGAVVIVGLIVVFAPMAFDRTVPVQLQPGNPIPAEPHWMSDNIEIATPEDLRGNADQRMANGSLNEFVFELDDKVKITKAVPPTNSPIVASTEGDEAGEFAGDQLVANVAAQIVPVVTTRSTAWSVQLATFAERVNAQALQESLRRSGYPAYTIQVQQGASVMTRVLVGPELDKLSADKLKVKLDELYKLEAMVIPYDPIAG